MAKRKFFSPWNDPTKTLTLSSLVFQSAFQSSSSFQTYLSMNLSTQQVEFLYHATEERKLYFYPDLLVRSLKTSKNYSTLTFFFHPLFSFQSIFSIVFFFSSKKPVQKTIFIPSSITTRLSKQNRVRSLARSLIFSPLHSPFFLRQLPIHSHRFLVNLLR